MKLIIYSSIFLLAAFLFAEKEEIVIRLGKAPDGGYQQISEKEYQKTERRDFSFELLPTEEALKQVGEAFGKRIIIYDSFENSKSSGELKEVSFEGVMEALLHPLGYEFKEFEGDIVVVTLSRKNEN